LNTLQWGRCHKRQKPQAPTPQAPIRNRQTRKVANAEVRNRYTNLTYIMIGLPIIWRLRLFSFGGYGLALAALALAVFGAIGCILSSAWNVKVKGHELMWLHSNPRFANKFYSTKLTF